MAEWGLVEEGGSDRQLTGSVNRITSARACRRSFPSGSSEATSVADLLDEVAERREHVTITRHGRPAAVVIPVDEYEALEETAEILSDDDTLAAIRRGLDDLEAVLDALGVLECDPSAGYQLRGRLTGLWSYRVGVYRIIHEVRDPRKVHGVATRHHGQTYRSDPR